MMVVSLLIVIIVGVIAAFLFANTFTRPIRSLIDIADQLALGVVDVAITYTGINEIGHLADTFRNMAENTKENAKAVSKIAAGDIAFEVFVASDKDVEGHALVQMKDHVFLVHSEYRHVKTHI